MKGSHLKVYTNALFQKITWIYGVVLILLGLLASYLAYDKETGALANRLNQTMSELQYAYESCTEDFWRYYLPIVENEGGMYDSLRVFFLSGKNEDLSPVEKDKLADAMQKLMAYNHGVSWVGLYTEKDNRNYLMFRGESVLQTMPQDFPFAEKIDQKGAAMEIYGSEQISTSRGMVRSFALCGNATINVQDGKIIFGYETDLIGSAFVKTEETSNINYYIVNANGIVFDSSGEYDNDMIHLSNQAGNLVRLNGKLMRVYQLSNTGSKYSIFCTIPRSEEAMVGHAFSPYILAIVVLFWASSLLVYRWTSQKIWGKIRAIQTGLHKIGENELDHRIPVPRAAKDEFDSIGRSINDMTARLQENINKTYELKLKQKEAELSELQAKFDPHFLYNTLEVIRGKVYENGDMETSDVIIKMAQLFRNLIGSENFVTVRDELDLCNSYLSLMEYRYEDRVDIIYDIESDVMQYGIIRNLLQPVLENFFVHGIDEEKWKQTLRIRGKIYDEEYIWFYVQDDGLGIPADKLKSLISNLEDATGNTQSYGLRNVQRRIKLFYGPDCGLALKNNELGGATVEIKIKRLTLEEHESRLNG